MNLHPHGFFYLFLHKNKIPFKVRNPKYKPKSQKFFFFYFFFGGFGTTATGGAESGSLPTLSLFPFYFFFEEFHQLFGGHDKVRGFSQQTMAVGFL